MAIKKLLTKKNYLRSGLAAFALFGLSNVDAITHEKSPITTEHSADARNGKTDRLRHTINRDTFTFGDLYHGDFAFSRFGDHTEALSFPAEITRATQNGFTLAMSDASFETVEVRITSRVAPQPEPVREISQEEFDARFTFSAEEVENMRLKLAQYVVFDQMPVGNACGINQSAKAYFDSVINGSDATATRVVEVLDQGRREYYRFSSRSAEITDQTDRLTLSEMQSALKTVGCYTAEISGVFDEHTTEALSSFQTAIKSRYANIEVTGRADTTTMHALGYEATNVLFYDGKRDFLSRFLRLDLDDNTPVALVEDGCSAIAGLASFRTSAQYLDINATAADVGIRQNYVADDLEKGASDANGYGPVRLAQFQLATLQCTGSSTIKHGAIDGVFGSTTENWVKKFQTQYGEKYELEVNGKLDEQTRAALSYESSIVIAFINSEIEKRSAQYGVDPEKLTRLFMHESLGVPIMESGTGPAGLGQPTRSLSQNLAEELGYERPSGISETVAFQTDIAKNVNISAYYFGQLLNTAETKAPNFTEGAQFQMAYTSYRDGPSAGIRAINALLNGNTSASLNGAGVNGTSNLAVGKIEEHFDKKMNEPHKVGRGNLFNSMRQALVSARQVFNFAATSPHIPAAEAKQYKTLPHPLFARFSGPTGGLF